MSRKHKRRSEKVGLPAGSLIHIGEVKTERPELVLISFDGNQLTEKAAGNLTDLCLPEAVGTRWLNVYGLHDPDLMAEIGRTFNLHPLVLEDILNTDQRPKLDTYDDYLFLVTRFFSYDKSSMLIGSEQVSIVLGRDFVLTFQERRTGSFDPLRERLRANKGHIRTAGPGYLAYALLDIIVDRYFIALEQISDDCETLEDEVLDKPTTCVLQNIHKLKRESVTLRRAVWPLREVVNSLIRNESGFFTHETVLYLRDVYDHTVHFIESLEALRDLLAGMLDIYLSSISKRVNMEVRALTVMAMLFMPATLIAGVFGMNFKYIPLLDSADGFWVAMGGMATIASVMGLIFWRRQWLSRH
ncbi:magnesium transporter [Novimethylophilus kurashikiensis]|uniref:Magnesium transport protein CorA n=1 Tax=Novimethylophilus kurashikiensis TaxID=1825523 RepID=A0A2R5F4D2_9PROT|nr:magnesium/cobalt transporter CorA [Novimethylophilus kurashikiensis]GBG12879.1 magnesium transporter [Novimethylophilus kurashikiensis]